LTFDNAALKRQPRSRLYQRVHRSRGIGWWLVLLVILRRKSAVLIWKMRWSITFYETQTKQSDIFSIFSVICVRPFKLSINSTVTKTGWLCCQNVSKLCFASVRLCDCKRPSAHNFVDFCRQTTPTTSEVLRCRSPSRCPPSSLTRQMLRRRNVVQSPFTVVEVDLSVGDDHRCCRKPH